jgi:hypothetical protein
MGLVMFLAAGAAAAGDGEGEVLAEIPVEIDNDGDATHEIVAAYAELVQAADGTLSIELEYSAENVNSEDAWGHAWEVELQSGDGTSQGLLSGVSLADLLSGKQATFSQALGGAAVDAADPGEARLVVRGLAAQYGLGQSSDPLCSQLMNRATCESTIQSSAAQWACDAYCFNGSLVDATAPYCGGMSCSCHSYTDPQGKNCERCSVHYQCTWTPGSATDLFEQPDLFRQDFGRPPEFP